MPKDARSRYWVRSLHGTDRYTVRALSIEDAALRVIWRWFGRRAAIRRVSGVWRKQGIFQAYAYSEEKGMTALGVPFMVEPPSRSHVRQFPIKELPHYPFDEPQEMEKAASG
jgi:hypothetical protein